MTAVTKFEDIQTFDYEGDLCIWHYDDGPVPEGVAIEDLVTHTVKGQWNVSSAKQIVQGRPPTAMIYPAELASIAKNVTIDRDHAMLTNLDEPIIAVQITLGKMKDLFVIDGWHRIFKAVKLGIENIPCYILSEEETKTVTESWTVTRLNNPNTGG